MSGADHTRPTRQFDLSQLAKLVGEDEPVSDQAPTLARCNTIEDPMTTQLLAQVARSRETVEFDAQVVDKAVDTLASGATSHPHTRRRTR